MSAPPIPSAQTIQNGVGSSAKPANLALRGQQTRLAHISLQNVQNPVSLTRILQEMSADHRVVSNAALSNPFASCMIVRGISVPSGQFSVNHHLGRAYAGWFPVRVLGAAVQLFETNLNAGLDPKLQLSLTASGAGATIDLCIF